MTKFLALLALGGLLMLPVVSAQVLPASTMSVTINDFPANATINGTLMTLPFTAVVTITSTSPCASNTNTGYNFEVSAEILNATSNLTTVQVTPSTFRAAGSNAAPGTITRQQQGQVLISPGQYEGEFLNASVRLTIKSNGGNGGCTGAMPVAATSATADSVATFLPVQGYGSSNAPAGREMPGFPGAFLMLALGALVAVLRRN